MVSRALSCDVAVLMVSPVMFERSDSSPAAPCHVRRPPTRAGRAWAASRTSFRPFRSGLVSPDGRQRPSLQAVDRPRLMVLVNCSIGYGVATLPEFEPVAATGIAPHSPTEGAQPSAHATSGR